MAIKLNLYILKKFLSNFALVLLSITLLLVMINIFELLDKVTGKQMNFGQIFLLDVLQIPPFIEDISIFLVMFASMITLFSLSIRSEIAVMRASGLSFWQILSPITFGALILGLFFVLIFNPLSITSSKKLNIMEQELVEKEETDLLAPSNGIWLKQENFLNKDEEIIRATSIYRKNLKMSNVSIWFFDFNHKFYKKIDAKNMFLEDGYWHLHRAVVNDNKNINQRVETLKIATNLKAEFIIKKVLNNFENARLFSVYDLPVLIKDLKGSGFSPRKFVVYYNSLLSKPFVFIAMVLLAAFFSINNTRSRHNILSFVSGIAVGLVVYISFIIINALGSSGLIPSFLATWIVAIILMTISMLLIFKKEAIN